MENSKKTALRVMTDIASLEMESGFAAALAEQRLDLECDIQETLFNQGCAGLPVEVNFAPAGNKNLRLPRRP